MAFSNPIVGGENKLIRDEIESQNYVANVSGWRIGKLGDAEFNDLIARGSIEVTGDGDAHLKIYSLGGTPVIEIKDEAGEEFLLHYVTNDWFSLSGITGQTMPRIDLVGEQGLFFTSDGSNGTQAVGFMMEGANGTSVSDSPGFIKRFGPNGFTDIEDWIALTYSNGWSNTGGVYQTGRYRLGPDGFVRLEGLIKPGTTTNGTTVFTLPAGYRPGANHIFCCNDGSATANVGLIIASSGVGSCWGVGAGGMSLSGVSFAVAALA